MDAKPPRIPSPDTPNGITPIGRTVARRDYGGSAPAAAQPAPASPPTSSATTPSLMIVPATEAQNGFGRLVDQAAAGQDIAITRHNVERVVLVSAPRYHQLIARDELARGAHGGAHREAHDVGGFRPTSPSTPSTSALDRLAAEFEALFARMQTPEVRAATASALRASPDEMGQAAVEAARDEARVATREAVPASALSLG